MEVNAQEKYYLSRFRPLTGMVLSSRIYKRSPVQFSPPYGDCTEWHCLWAVPRLFSPPYGDCTLNISQNTAKLKSWMARKYSLYYNDVFFALKRTDTNSFGLPCARGSFMI